ncbi:MAG: DUF938 domain-containing protein [Pseudomonadota bacterium]|nr:MAG: SAM-dependent methyltransferase [Pseudomonadota bacterium]
MSDAFDALGLPIWPAAERNKQPIAEVLVPLLANREGVFLEIASGTGQHIVHFAGLLPRFTFVPSDCDPEHLDTLRRRVEATALPNLNAPLAIDVTWESWPIAGADVVYNANMMHIAPLEAARGLFRGASRVLPSGGLLVTYGPYRFSGKHVSESNERFDASLRSRNPDWGVRDVDDLETFAREHGLVLGDRIAMPANNFTLVWTKA